MTLPKIEIRTPGPSGMMTETFIDGQKIHGITAICVRIGMNEPNEVVIHLLGEVIVEGHADAKYHLVIADPTDGEVLMASGTDVVEMLDDVRGRLWEKRP